MNEPRGSPPSPDVQRGLAPNRESGRAQDVADGRPQDGEGGLAQAGQIDLAQHGESGLAQHGDEPTRDARPQRMALAAGLAALAAAVMWLPRIGPWWLDALVPSALVLVGLGFLAWAWLPLDQAASVAAAAYVVIGFLLAVAKVAYIGTARSGISLLAIFAWPSLVLVEIGRWIGVVPLPE